MLRAGDGIVLCVLALLCVGVVMVNSAGLTLDPDQAVTFESILWSRPALYMAMASLVMFAVALLRVDRMARRPALFRLVPALFPALIVMLMLVYAPVVGKEVNGAKRWLQLPGTGFSMQPSELAKWGLLMVLAWHGARRAGVMHRFDSGLLPGLLIIGPIAGMIAKEDLGTGVLIGAAGCVVLIAAGARLWQLLAFVPIAAVGVLIAVITSPYRMTRLTAFLDPYADPEGSGYHMIQSLVAVANGQFFGRGLGFGLQKFGYLPEDRTDFLFAVICEELGVAGALLVMALYLAVIWCGASIIRREPSPFLKLLGIGVISTFGFQALINLFVVTGLAPTKGIALPLLSQGGTGWIMTAASLGVLVAMDRCHQMAWAPALDAPRPLSAAPSA